MDRDNEYFVVSVVLFILGGLLNFWGLSIDNVLLGSVGVACLLTGFFLCFATLRFGSHHRSLLWLLFRSRCCFGHCQLRRFVDSTGQTERTFDICMHCGWVNELTSWLNGIRNGQPRPSDIAATPWPQLSDWTHQIPYWNEQILEESA
jgi:hypothetical protein